MLNLKEIKNNISSGLLLAKVRCFFSGKIEFFVFALFILLSVFCIYIWYSYVYNYQWSEDKKTEYLKTKNNEITFDRKKFQEIIEKEKKRTEDYKKATISEKDIFGIKR
jgi:hypothetical protein